MDRDGTRHRLRLRADRRGRRRDLDSGDRFRRRRRPAAFRHRIPRRPRRCGARCFDLSLRPEFRRRTEAGTSRRRHSCEVAVLIPSIDLMGGKIVQLIQGSKKALESTDFEAWIERFSRYSLVQLIDLDAAMGKGSNRALVEQFCSRLPCQVGGGIRSIEAAEDVLRRGRAADHHRLGAGPRRTDRYRLCTRTRASLRARPLGLCRGLPRRQGGDWWLEASDRTSLPWK